jgi:hypothetical protein
MFRSYGRSYVRARPVAVKLLLSSTALRWPGTNQSHQHCSCVSRLVYLVCCLISYFMLSPTRGPGGCLPGGCLSASLHFCWDTPWLDPPWCLGERDDRRKPTHNHTGRYLARLQGPCPCRLPVVPAYTHGSQPACQPPCVVAYRSVSVRHTLSRRAMLATSSPASCRFFLGVPCAAGLLLLLFTFWTPFCAGCLSL